MNDAKELETSYVKSIPGKSKRRQRSTCSCISKRYVLAILICFGFIFDVSLQVTLSVSLVGMVSNLQMLNGNGTRTSLKPAEFNWNTKTQGIILSSYFYGYAAIHLPTSYLIARYGGKNVFGGGILMAAVFSLLIPAATRVHHYLLISLRILTGLSSGVTMPCMSAIWSKWAPPLERSKLANISASGIYSGPFASMVFSGLLVDAYGWTSPFYVFGTITLLWGILWFWLITDSPQDDPTISDEELNYIKDSLKDDQTEMKIQSIPWKKIMTSAPVIALTVASMVGDWTYNILLTYMPTYFQAVHHFDIKKTGFLAGLPYLLSLIVMLAGGPLADCLLKRRLLSTTVVRKLFLSVAFLGQASSIVAVGITKDKYFAVIGLILVLGLCGLVECVTSVNHLDFAPRYAGLLMTITDFFGSLSGIYGPLLVGLITTHNSPAEWRMVFWITFAINLFGMIIYLIFGSGEKQHWAEIDCKEVTRDNDEIGEDNNIDE